MWRYLLAYAALVNAALAQEHSITLSGPPELFLSHAQMNCGPTARGSGLDVTDIPVTAFRRKDGSVVVLSGNQNNYYLVGPSVDQAKRRSCDNLVKPVNRSDPQSFAARRWLFTIHAKNYDFVIGFVHNEYHGSDFFHDQCQRSSLRNFECWYSATGLVVSRDGGFTFDTPAPPDNILAAPPSRFELGKKRIGTGTPKVVANPADGMTYVMINFLDRNRDIRAFQCLLRGSSKDLNDWRAWDGNGFNMDMESPYVRDRSGDCRPVLPYVVQSLKYVPSIRKFVSLGHNRAQLVYAFSNDLIQWSTPTVLMDFVAKQRRRSGDPPARDYFSLLDPDSSSINFDTLETRPYLFFVQYTDDRRKRDVYRIPLTIR